MTLRNKLLALVFLPVLLCTTVAVTISLLKVRNQGIEGLKDKSSAILSLSMQEYIINHQLGFSIIEQDSNDEIFHDDESFVQSYEFRIASLEPENPEHIATPKDNIFIKQFEKEELGQINYIDKETNNLLAMRPVYMEESKGCLDCHKPAKGVRDIKNENALRGIFIVTSSMEQTNAQVNSAITKISLYGFLIMVVAIVVGYFVSAKIISSVRQINSVSRKVAKGDLQQKVTIRTGDELEELGSYINIMIDSLNDVLLGVNDATNELSLSTNEIAHTSKALSHGASKSAASIEDVSSTMEEMTSNIKQNTEDAQQTEIIAMKASKEILKGNEAVNQTVLSMKEIAGKITIISEIATQTNILALNAAVEAARAGEHGKGFAVVSSEVRKLAERCQQAANQIEELTSSSVTGADMSGRVLTELVPEIQNTAKYVRGITASSIEQSKSSTQVNTVIQRINHVSQENASASENLATNAGKLESQTEKLKDLISFFKMDTHLDNQEIANVL